MPKLLLLDLDETLVYSTTKPLSYTASFQYQKYHVYKRPKLDWFIRSSSEKFNIGVWSAADEDYVANICQKIFPNDIQLKIMWSQYWCKQELDKFSNQTIYVKDFQAINRLGLDVKNVLLLDDKVHTSQVGNNSILQIKPFKGALDDNELDVVFNQILKSLA